MEWISTILDTNVEDLKDNEIRGYSYIKVKHRQILTPKAKMATWESLLLTSFTMVVAATLGL